MARPLRIQYSGAFYHVMCRGNERRKIFLDNEDRYHFLRLLKESLKIYQVILHTYILMDNHFHLVVQTVQPNLSEFMRRFNICYTGWFHYHHNTCGHLYQGRYKALLVDADHYLLELSRYVHLNPVRGGGIPPFNHSEKWQQVKEYRWSSIGSYLNARHTVDFVECDLILGMAGGRQGYQTFLREGLKEELYDIFDKVQHQSILGDEDFAAFVKERHLGEASIREQPMYRSIVKKLCDAETVVSCVADALGVEKTRIVSKSGDGVIRGILAEMLYRYSALEQRAIGILLGGIEYTAVSMLRRRLKGRMEKDHRVSEQYQQVERRLGKICEV